MTRDPTITRDGLSTVVPRERALVLHPVPEGRPESRGESRGESDVENRLAEAAGLAHALDFDVAESSSVRVRKFAPATYFGAGRVESLKDAIEAQEISVVVVDTALSPVQQRNLEKAWNAKVIDRTGLILEIFGRRARTHEGRLQVELARLGYERSRLVRTWTHLERQRGGLGKTGGPGETQIELDRRQIADRIVRLKRELEDVRRTRGLARRARTRAGYPSVVLVGYTNAGKSSLFNRLTRAGVFAKDMPFATLDPTSRLVRLPSGRSAIFSDTVGFITDLPTELIAAFRATLEAVSEADLLVHVRDIAHPETESQKTDVMAVLAQLDKSRPLPPIVEAWNKIDLLDADRRAARLARAVATEAKPPVPISALTGEGTDALLVAVDQSAFAAQRLIAVRLDPADGRTRAWIAARGRILEERLEPDGMIALSVELSGEDAARLDPALIAAPERLAAE